MRKLILFKPAVMMCAIVMLWGCDPTVYKAKHVEDARQEVEDKQVELAKATEKYKEEIRNYRVSVLDKIDRNNKKIADLKEKIKNEPDEVKVEFQGIIDVLEKRNKELKDKFENHTDEGAESWKTFKTEMSQDMDELDVAFKEASVNNSK